MHFALIVIGACFALWLIPTIFGWLIDAVLWVIKLPFKLLWLLIADGIGGFLALLWRLVRGFFGLFGWVGTIVMWGLIVAGVVLGLLFLAQVLSEAIPSSRSSGSSGSAGQGSTSGSSDTSGTGGGSTRDRRQSSDSRDQNSAEPPAFGQREWALRVLSLPQSASPDEIRQRFRDLVKSVHPDHLPANATQLQREEAEKRMAQINQAYQILTH